MNPKKLEIKPNGYYDYTVYPLEGVWDINEEAKKNFNGTINKDDLVFKLMIRQPDFLDDALYKEMYALTKSKKPHRLLDQIKLERISEGKCIQMMHHGSFDSEPVSFEKMEKFASDQNLIRKSKIHREIYLSDFRKVPEEKYKTILRFQVIDKK